MKMWDGRFTQGTDHLMEVLNNSLPVDKALIEEDVAGNVAWAGALARAGILSQKELRAIQNGLRAILADSRAGKLRFAESDEDIHMAVERLLTERVGEAGARIHTGRSRNDQVVTDFRLYAKKALARVTDRVTALQTALVTRAERDASVIVPGYTHMQQAQPVLLAHYWLSLFWALEREKSRLAHAIETADVMPLGSGALAGAGFAVDREFLARELGFSRISENSMDAVASRDFVLEALSAISSLGILLSRYAEDLILWSTREFGFVELSDAWSTGSSMMPQKKNPDSLELVRGISARFIGNYTRMATTLKGVGLTYYKDLQGDKEVFFDSEGQILLVLQVLTGVVGSLTVKTARITGALDPFLLATDVADYLVSKGMPFRQAHKVVGKMVAHCIEKDVALTSLKLSELKAFAPEFGKDALRIFDWSAAIAHRDLPGGTGRKSVARQLTRARAIVRGS